MLVCFEMLSKPQSLTQVRLACIFFPAPFIVVFCLSPLVHFVLGGFHLCSGHFVSSFVNADNLQRFVTSVLSKNISERIICLSVPGIIRDAAASELGDKWFGQQAVYRVSMGNFVSVLVSHNTQIKVIFQRPPANMLHSILQHLKRVKT